MEIKPAEVMMDGRTWTLPRKWHGQPEKKNRPIQRAPCRSKKNTPDLRADFEIYGEIFDYSNKGILYADRNGSIQYINSSFARLLGIPHAKPESLHLKDIAAILHIEDKFKSLIRNDSPDLHEGQTIAIVDGRSACIQYVLRKNPLCGKSGFYSLVCHDGTLAKETEMALYKTNLEFKRLLTAIPAIIYAFSLQKGIMYVSPYVEENLGYSEEFLLAHPFYAFERIHPEDERKVQNFLTESRPGKNHAMEFRVLDSTDKWHSFYTQLFSRKTVIDEVIIEGIALDITERKEAERAMEASELHFRTLFEESPISLWEEDASGLKNYIDRLKSEGIDDFRKYLDTHPVEVRLCASMVHVIAVNKATVKLFGAENRNQFIGDLGKYLAEDSIETLKEIVISVADGKKSFTHDSAQRTFSGGKIDASIHWTIVPLYAESLSRVYVAIVDVSNIRAAERKLAEYRYKLRYLSSHLILAEEEEKRKLAAAIHDNIGQTLSMSKIKLMMMKKKASRQINLQFIDDIIGFIDQTITDTRSLIFDLSPRNLYEIGLDSAISSLLEKICEEHNLRYNFYADPLDNSIRKDIAVFLYRSVKEAIINVIKHACADMVKVSIRKESEGICITIEDNGRGFDVSHINVHSFDKGGFGLFDIRERLEYLGGRLAIESHPDSGTKLEFIVPLIY